MLNVLISIKPQYVNEILSGTKKYEYRKRIFVRPVDKVYIYSTSPEQKIVGYFKYTGYLKESPAMIWENTRKFSGIDEKAYYKYFNGNAFAYAIKIDKVHIFDTPIDPKGKNKKFTPPQSYMYIEGDI